MIIACAVAAKADFLVSRDKDLLTIGSYEAIDMVTPESSYIFCARRRKALAHEEPYYSS